MDSDAQPIDRRILAFIEPDGGSESFDGLAMDLFAYQYAHNAVYHAYCDQVLEGQGGSEPGRPRPRPLHRNWRDIPAVWPVAWRLTELCCFDPRQAVAAFLSSGTTSGVGGSSLGRGRHLFDTVALYEAAFAGPFAAALLPLPLGEGAGVRMYRDTFPVWRESRVPLLVLMPSPDESPESSLSFMMGQAIVRFGLPEASGFFVHEGRFLLAEFAAAIEAVTQSGNPVVVASTAFGWVTLLEWLGDRRLPLPAGSRIMETGGYKGRSAEWPRAELYARLAGAFAVPRDAIVSEYGMCELSSQFYSRGSGVGGRGSEVGGEESGSNSFSPTTEGRGERAIDRGVIFHGPPWTRVLAIDPETQLPVPPGEAGLLRVIDLANRGSCIAVQTEDLAIVHGDSSFELLGRAPSAPPKGCSLTAEDQGLVASG